VRDVTEHVPQPPAPGTIFDTKQQPNLFRNISLRTAATSNAATVIVIDALETPTVAQMYVRQQSISFFRKMPSGDVFAIFQLDTHLHLIQGFSADPKTLYAAVEGKRDMPDLPIGMSKIHRKQVLDQAMYAMGHYLEAFRGRKNIIWFTSAVPGKMSGLRDNPSRMQLISRRERLLLLHESQSLATGITVGNSHMAVIAGSQSMLLQSTSLGNLLPHTSDGRVSKSTLL
jgi:hypothetical protein